MDKSQELLRKFDRAVAEMERKISSLKGKPYLQEYLSKVKEMRAELVTAIDDDETDRANRIIDKAVAFGREVDRMVNPAEKAPGLPFLGQFFGPPSKTKIAPSPKKEKKAVAEKHAEHHEAYDGELTRLEEALARRDVEVEGLKGAYAKLAGEMGEMRRKMESQHAKDTTELSAQVKELKAALESLHATMDKEFNATKASYSDFAGELLNVAVQVSEIEENIEHKDIISEVDVLELNNAVAALEKKLAIAEADEKRRRLELLDSIQHSQSEMMKKLGGKAETKNIVNAMKQYVSEVKQEIEDRDAKIAADMQVELKSSYYTLSKQVKSIEKDLVEARSKKDLEALRGEVAKLGNHLDKVREEEGALQKELEQQHLSDEALMQRIDTLAEQVEKSDATDSEAMADLRKSIAALEMELTDRPRSREVQGHVSYLKAKLLNLESSVLTCDECGKKCATPRGLYLHKKMAHAFKHRTLTASQRQAKGKRKSAPKAAKATKKAKPPAKKKLAAKKPAKKGRHLFGFLGD